MPRLDGVVKDGVEDFVEQPVAQRQLAALFVELFEVLDHALFGGGHLDRLHCAEEFADEAGDDAGGAAAGAPVFVDALGLMPRR